MALKKSFDRDLGENNGNGFVNSYVEFSAESNSMGKSIKSFFTNV